MKLISLKHIIARRPLFLSVWSSTHLIESEARDLVHTFSLFDAGAYSVYIADVVMSVTYHGRSQHCCDPYPVQSADRELHQASTKSRQHKQSIG